jgi:hypothetical protein
MEIHTTLAIPKMPSFFPVIDGFPKATTFGRKFAFRDNA